MNNTTYKRRNVFIKKGFQIRFIAGVIALILLSGLCSALLIYWITGSDLEAQSLSAHVSIANAWERLGMSILIGNVISILVVGAAAVATVLYASHKIAGPLHSFENMCEEIGNGNLDTMTQLREEDQLQALALSFSTMVGKLRERRDRRAKLLGDINCRIKVLASMENLAVEQRNMLIALTEAVEKLSKVDDKNA